jgi:hypothetical protein
MLLLDFWAACAIQYAFQKRILETRGVPRARNYHYLVKV